MKALSSNRDLFDYLGSLAADLQKRSAHQLSDAVTKASRHAASTSTEFLGEARIALRRISEEENGVLSALERKDLLEVIRQLDNAFACKR